MNFCRNLSANLEKFPMIIKKFTHSLSTVYALSSGQGTCGVAVIRITGKKSNEALKQMTKLRTIKPRFAHLTTIYHPLTGEPLDKSLVMWFPSPNSFTGEDLVEFHVHGGMAVISSVLNGLGTLPDFHPAISGDFTRRAFHNGKLDLTNVEGLGDLIHAQTEAQRRQALKQMEGSLGKIYTNWRSTIIKCRATLEAYIDFSEDEMIHNSIIEEVKLDLINLCKEISDHLCDSRRGERLRTGVRFVILGKPNVGKSSFLNAVLQEPKAIVSPIAGTTRDVIESTIDLGGYPVIFSDTAGLRLTDDPVEKEGVSRAWAMVKEADLAVIVADIEESKPYINSNNIFDENKFITDYMEKTGNKSNLNSFEWRRENNFIVLINKIDLLDSQNREIMNKSASEICFPISVKTGEGLMRAIQEITFKCAEMCGKGDRAESTYLTSTRHRTHLTLSYNHLRNVLFGMDYEEESLSVLLENRLHNNLLKDEAMVFAAHEIYLAGNEVGRITGHITTEDVLDRIFESFCIGK